MILYRVCRGAVVAICRLYWRVDFTGLENVPATGAYVVAPVHRSFLDFGLVAGITSRRLRYMGKEELWRSAALGRLISALGAFPVSRGTVDREALRRCLEVVETGEPLVLFPEGTRRSGPVVAELFEGASYVAARAQIPIVPVGIGGSERALRRGQRLPRPVKVSVVVGEPILPPPPADGTDATGRVPRRQVRELTQELSKRLQDLFDEAQIAAGGA